MTDIMISQNIDLSSWNILYNLNVNSDVNNVVRIYITTWKCLNLKVVWYMPGNVDFRLG
jgi:hypothetical protein